MASTIAHRRPAQIPRLRPLLIVVAALVIAGGSYVASGLGIARPNGAPIAVGLPPDAPAAVDAPLVEIDGAIATWTGNLQRDDADFIAAVNLAELYLARTRISGDSADVNRALDAAERALVANPDLTAARLLRGQAHFANHDFTQAADDAQAVLDAEPGSAGALAALGDAQLELGDYDAASATYGRLAVDGSGPAVVARQARLASLTGSLAVARTLAAQAADDAAADPDVRPETVAWYHTLAGALAFQAGDLDASTAAYQAALEAWNGSAAALAGLARATAGLGDLDGAIGLYERSIAILPRPEVLAALGDLQALTGDGAGADATYAKVAAVASLTPSDRQIALFEANHGRDVDLAVERARRDLTVRHDAYAHDTLAWALLASGDALAADAEMQLARAAGTEDPLLDYHAGMIAAANGRDAEAATLLSNVLDRAPGFDPLQAERARATLAVLGGRP